MWRELDTCQISIWPEAQSSGLNPNHHNLPRQRPHRPNDRDDSYPFRDPRHSPLIYANEWTPPDRAHLAPDNIPRNLRKYDRIGRDCSEVAAGPEARSGGKP